MRVALAGLGGAARHGHLPALRQLEAERHLRLVAVADPASEQRRKVGEGLSGVPAFASADSMLSAVDCDVLVVATEPSSHARLVELGLRRGVDVVCEKPLAHTARDRAVVEAAVEERRDLAVVSVHQYRHAAPWVRLAPLIGAANASRTPFSISAEVWRDGVEDPRSSSPWRAELSRLGGLLADHAAHFIALAWTVDPAMSVLGGDRDLEAPGRERSWGRIRVGSGILDLSMSTVSSERRSRLQARAPGVEFDWPGRRAQLCLNSRPPISWKPGALSDRAYLDSLYPAFYRDLVLGLPNKAWRSRRTAESVGVGSVLVDLLERVALNSTPV